MYVQTSIVPFLQNILMHKYWNIYLFKYSQSWDLRLFSHGERSLHSKIQFLTQFVSGFLDLAQFSYSRQYKKINFKFYFFPFLEKIPSGFLKDEK